MITFIYNGWVIHCLPEYHRYVHKIAVWTSGIKHLINGSEIDLHNYITFCFTMYIGRKELFYLMMHSADVMYGYVALDIW